MNKNINVLIPFIDLFKYIADSTASINIIKIDYKTIFNEVQLLLVGFYNEIKNKDNSINSSISSKLNEYNFGSFTAIKEKIDAIKLDGKQVFRNEKCNGNKHKINILKK